MKMRRATLRFLLAASLGLGLASAGVAAFAEPPAAGHAPDPPARPSHKQWVFNIKVANGIPRVASVQPVRLKKPSSTARVMGRYALELYVGRELLDRIRFNVPLTGDGPTPKEDKRPFRRPTFERVNVHIRVRMADHPRATYAVLVDRATGKTERLSWPPGSDAPAKPPTPTDAGAPSAPGQSDGGASDAGSPAQDGGGAADAGPPAADGGPPAADAATTSGP